MSNLALTALAPRQQAVVTALNVEFAVRERLAALLAKYEQVADLTDQFLQPDQEAK